MSIDTYLKWLFISFMILILLTFSLSGIQWGIMEPIKSGHLPLYQMAEYFGISEMGNLIIFGIVFLLFMPVILHIHKQIINTWRK